MPFSLSERLCLSEENTDKIIGRPYKPAGKGIVVKMKKGLFKGKSKRTKILTLISLAMVAVIIGLNLMLAYFGHIKTIFLDMTPEGLYTLSDAMVEECDKMFGEIEKRGDKKKVTVTFCTDPDYLISSEKARLTYFMALKLQNKYPDSFEVKTENVFLNPTAVSQYKATSLSTIDADDVIISYGDSYETDGYRIASFDYFWTEGTSDSIYYNGEYRIASLVKSVTAISNPVAYFVIGHGESYYDAENPDSEMSRSLEAFCGLLKNRGLDIKLLDLSSADRVPEDCALLIINNPRIDFTYDEDRLDEFSYVSDTEKLDRYLVMKQGAIVVAKDYEIKLPVFETFLHEWGFDFSSSVLVDKESSLSDSVSGEKTGTSIIAQYSTDSESYGYTLYGEYADLSSAPLTVFENAGSLKCSFTESSSEGEAGTGYASRRYTSFLTTSDKAQHYIKDKETGEITSYVDGTVGRYDLAALTIRHEIDHVENVLSYSYLFCVNSKDFFDSSLLGNSSFANYDIVSAVIENISRVDAYASMDLGALTLNSSSAGGKLVFSTDMSAVDFDIRYIDGKIVKKNHGISTSAKAVYTCVIAIAPITAAAVGVVVSVKRRYL